MNEKVKIAAVIEGLREHADYIDSYPGFVGSAESIVRVMCQAADELTRLSAVPKDVEGLAKRLVGGPTSPDIGSHLRKYQALCDEAAAAIRALEGDETSTLAEMAKHTNWSLSYKSPFYCDDDDQETCWVVVREHGSINDREWSEIGKGGTPAEALTSALAANKHREKP